MANQPNDPQLLDERVQLLLGEMTLPHPRNGEMRTRVDELISFCRDNSTFTHSEILESGAVDALLSAIQIARREEPFHVDWKDMVESNIMFFLNTLMPLYEEDDDINYMVMDFWQDWWRISGQLDDSTHGDEIQEYHHTVAVAYNGRRSDINRNLACLEYSRFMDWLHTNGREHIRNQFLTYLEIEHEQGRYPGPPANLHVFQG